MLARLGTMLGDLEPVAPQEAFLNCLEDLLVVRAKHVDARAMLRQVAVEVDGESETVTTTTIAQLDDQIAGLETAIKAVIASDPEQAERYGILTSIPGVGPVTAAALLCWMPELGSLDHRQAAALIGVAPFADDSGQRHGARHVRGGRRRPRDLLFMAATTAAHHNEDLTDRVRTPQGRRQGPQGRDCCRDAQTHRAGEHPAAGAALLVARSASTTAEVSGSRPTERRRPHHGPDPR